MHDALEYIPLDEFPLKWRFAEDATKWTVLPDEDLEHFRPLSKDTCKALWRRFLPSPAGCVEWSEGMAWHWKHASAQLKMDSDWSPEEEDRRVTEFLRASIAVRSESTLLFLWSWHECAVETTWDIFVRYWSDFCYPCDSYAAAIPLDSPSIVLCCDDALFGIAPRLPDTQ